MDTRTYGTVTRYLDGVPLRPATAAEWRRTADMLASSRPGAETGAWVDKDGQAVYVDGGPDAGVSDAGIADLEAEAGSAGDSAMAALCRAALHGDTDARAECARVILDARMLMAG